MSGVGVCVAGVPVGEGRAWTVARGVGVTPAGAAFRPRMLELARALEGCSAVARGSGFSAVAVSSPAARGTPQAIRPTANSKYSGARSRTAGIELTNPAVGTASSNFM
jgi:hypothetical protein